MSPRMIRILTIFAFTFILISKINAKTQQTCNPNSSDCPYLSFCNKNESVCEHKKLFQLENLEIFGFFLIFLGSALSNAGGIGGGGLLIPILLLVFRFYTHDAIPLSKIMIFGGGVVTFIMGFNQKHPNRDSITIDYNIPYLIVPLMLFGTMVGVSLNKILPPLMILIFLTIVLVVNSYKTLIKANNLHKKEIQNSEKEKDKNLIFIIENENRKEKIKEGFDVNTQFLLLSSQRNNINLQIGEEDRKLLLLKEELKDKRKFHLEKIFIMFTSYSIMLFLTFVKGGEKFGSVLDIEKCSIPYWSLYFSYLPIALLISYRVSIKIMREYNMRIAIGFPFLEEDVKWCGKTCLKFLMIGFICGVLAGVLGIGGGLIIGPLFLQLGLNPLVSSSTTNFLVLFTSSSTTIQFIYYGMMNFEYGIACLLVSTFGSLIGNIIIQRILEKTKRFSLLIFALGIVLALSTILVPVQTLLDIIDDLKKEKNIWSFNTIC